MNDDEKPHGLFRGEEKLDEQELYQIVGDVESEDAVKASRAGGSTLQALGVTLVAVGAATAAFAVVTTAFAPGGWRASRASCPASRHRPVEPRRELPACGQGQARRGERGRFTALSWGLFRATHR